MIACSLVLLMQCPRQEFLQGKPTFTCFSAVADDIINASHIYLAQGLQRSQLQSRTALCPAFCLLDQDCRAAPKQPAPGRGTGAMCLRLHGGRRAATKNGQGHVVRAPNRKTPVPMLTSIRNQKQVAWGTSMWHTEFSPHSFGLLPATKSSGENEN